ncbi:MAG: hypothetical protein KF831_13220 [Acidobacteria bacterium]|nr:hypothetical protein [Acidobacteriota bacterium]
MIAVLDCNILVDLFLNRRPRSRNADVLANFLAKENIKVRIPMHAMFELASALKQEADNPENYNFSSRFTSMQPFEVETVDIDQSFFQQYFREDFPLLRGGDLIYFAYAVGEKRAGKTVVLLTEDSGLHSAAREAGIEVYTLSEFVKQIGGE